MDGVPIHHRPPFIALRFGVLQNSDPRSRPAARMQVSDDLTVSPSRVQTDAIQGVLPNSDDLVLAHFGGRTCFGTNPAQSGR